MSKQKVTVLGSVETNKWEPPIIHKSAAEQRFLRACQNVFCRFGYLEFLLGSLLNKKRSSFFSKLADEKKTLGTFITELQSILKKEDRPKLQELRQRRNLFMHGFFVTVLMETNGCQDEKKLEKFIEHLWETSKLIQEMEHRLNNKYHVL